MDTKQIIREYIAREFLVGSRKDRLTDQDLLIERGIIDSMGVMTLLGFLEERFEMQIPPEDLLPENFASIEAIAALVGRHSPR